MEKGISDKRAHEHSTTARPLLPMISLSAGDRTCVALGLNSGKCHRESTANRNVKKTDERTMPRNREPMRSSVMMCCRASLFPEHRRGSQWSKSCVENCIKWGKYNVGVDEKLTHIATGTVMVTSVAGEVRGEGASLGPGVFCSLSSSSFPTPSSDRAPRAWTSSETRLSGQVDVSSVVTRRPRRVWAFAALPFLPLARPRPRARPADAKCAFLPLAILVPSYVTYVSVTTTSQEKLIELSLKNT